MNSIFSKLLLSFFCVLLLSSSYANNPTKNKAFELVTNSEIINNIISINTPNAISLTNTEQSNYSLSSFNDKKFINSDFLQHTEHKIRIGAVCKDGTRSNATGRGACSHHGGVRYWLYKTVIENKIDTQEPSGHNIYNKHLSTNKLTTIGGVTGRTDHNKLNDGRIYMTEFQSFGKYMAKSIDKESLHRFTWEIMNKYQITFQSVETRESGVLRFAAEKGDIEYYINLLIDQNIKGNVFLHFIMGSKKLKQLI